MKGIPKLFVGYHTMQISEAQSGNEDKIERISGNHVFWFQDEATDLSEDHHVPVHGKNASFSIAE